MPRNAENVRRLHIRAEGYVVRPIVPAVGDAGEEILDQEIGVVGDGEGAQVEVDPAALLIEWIEVYGDEDGVITLNSVR